MHATCPGIPAMASVIISLPAVIGPVRKIGQSAPESTPFCIHVHICIDCIDVFTDRARVSMKIGRISESFQLSC